MLIDQLIEVLQRVNRCQKIYAILQQIKENTMFEGNPHGCDEKKCLAFIHEQISVCIKMIEESNHEDLLNK